MTQKKNKKLLSTSINKRTSSLMDKFNSSIDIDQRLIEEDILVTQAHVSALVNLKIISKIEIVIFDPFNFPIFYNFLAEVFRIIP